MFRMTSCFVAPAFVVLMGGTAHAALTADQVWQSWKDAGAMAGLGAGPTGEARSRVRVIPDEPNNSLLIMATNQEYQQILAALKQMDVVPLQVLVDVTIAEVTLGDDLKYGVEWYFKNRVNNDNFNGFGISALDLGGAGIAPQVPGFSYTLQGLGGDIRFVLNMLAEESNLSVLSSPSILVLNNQEAKIQVASHSMALALGNFQGITADVDVEFANKSIVLRRCVAKHHREGQVSGHRPSDSQANHRQDQGADRDTSGQRHSAAGHR